MPNAARKGDPTTGHTTYPPQTITGGSDNVTINNKPAARQGDSISDHTNTVEPYDTHSGVVISGGSSKVTINNKPAARVGDALSCNPADTIASGSGNVTMGG